MEYEGPDFTQPPTPKTWVPRMFGPQNDGMSEDIALDTGCSPLPWGRGLRQPPLAVRTYIDVGNNSLVETGIICHKGLHIMVCSKQPLMRHIAIPSVFGRVTAPMQWSILPRCSTSRVKGAGNGRLDSFFDCMEEPIDFLLVGGARDMPTGKSSPVWHHAGLW